MGCTASTDALSIPNSPRDVFRTVMQSENLAEELEQMVSSNLDVNMNISHDLIGSCHPIHVAAYTGNLKALKILIEAGADVTLKDNKGKTALFWAISKSNIDVVEELVQAGSDVNHECTEGVTPLLTAIEYSTPTVVEILLEKGANSSKRQEMRLAVKENKPDIVLLLLQAKANSKDLVVSFDGEEMDLRTWAKRKNETDILTEIDRQLTHGQQESQDEKHEKTKKKGPSVTHSSDKISISSGKVNSRLSSSKTIERKNTGEIIETDIKGERSGGNTEIELHDKESEEKFICAKEISDSIENGTELTNKTISDIKTQNNTKESVSDTLNSINNSKNETTETITDGKSATIESVRGKTAKPREISRESIFTPQELIRETTAKTSEIIRESTAKTHEIIREPTAKSRQFSQSESTDESSEASRTTTKSGGRTREKTSMSRKSSRDIVDAQHEPVYETKNMLFGETKVTQPREMADDSTKIIRESTAKTRASNGEKKENSREQGLETTEKLHEMTHDPTSKEEPINENERLTSTQKSRKLRDGDAQEHLTEKITSDNIEPKIGSQNIVGTITDAKKNSTTDVKQHISNETGITPSNGDSNEKTV